MAVVLQLAPAAVRRLRRQHVAVEDGGSSNGRAAKCQARVHAMGMQEADTVAWQALCNQCLPSQLAAGCHFIAHAKHTRCVCAHKRMHHDTML